MSDDNECPTPAVCMQRFEQIDEKLDNIHEDFKALSLKVSNGITDRLNQVQGEVVILKEDRERREKMSNRVQLVVVGVMIALSTSLVMYAMRHYSEHSNRPAITRTP